MTTASATIRRTTLPEVWLTVGVAALVAAQGLDVWSTLAMPSRGTNELNPLMRPVISNLPLFLGMKMLVGVLIVVLAGIVYRAYRRSAVAIVWALVGVYAVMIFRNGLVAFGR